MHHFLFLCVVFLISSCKYNTDKKQEIKQIESTYDDCCRMTIPPNKTSFVDSLSKHLYISYCKGGRLADFSMDLKYSMLSKIERIVTTITFHTHEFSESGREKVFRVSDTIVDNLILRRLLDSIEVHNPLDLSCIQGYNDRHSTKGIVDVYFKHEDSSNCFFITDTMNSLNDPDYLFFMNIFNDSSFFPISLNDIQKHRDQIFDSLVEDYERKK